MSFANALKKAVDKVVKVKGIGADVILRRITLGTYNTTTGVIAETTSDTTVKGVIDDVNDREVNDLIQVNDRKCLISAASVSNIPTTTDRIIYSSVNYQIISVKTIFQAGVDLAYELILRA